MNIIGDMPMTGEQPALFNDPEDICAICNKHTYTGWQYPDEMFWIGCDGECEKWFHTHCVGMEDNEYERRQREKEDWLCTACTKNK